jgi:hypothetical protein
VLEVLSRLVCQPVVLEVIASKMDSDDDARDVIYVIMG